jgi:hypothetical protein
VDIILNSLLLTKQYLNNTHFSQALPTLGDVLIPTASFPHSLDPFVDFLLQNDQLGPFESTWNPEDTKEATISFHRLGGTGASQCPLQHLSSIYREKQTYL